MVENCGNCRFIRKQPHEREMPLAERFCHRRAPVVSLIKGRFLIGAMSTFRDEDGELDGDLWCEVGEPVHALWYARSANDEVDLDGSWPLVADDDWCGEWQPAQTQAQTQRISGDKSLNENGET